MTTAHIDPDALDRTVRSIDVSAIADTGLEAALGTVVDACHRLFTVDGCALLFLDSDRALQKAAASDPASAALEAAQEELGEGPCVETVVNDMLVYTRDVKVDERWPLLAARIADQPVQSVLGVPVRRGGACLGTLNVFRFAPYEWGRDRHRRAVGVRGTRRAAGGRAVAAFDYLRRRARDERRKLAEVSLDVLGRH